tara:strand:- start:2429 stop:3292 length:864 start_codon:yes stop_codon:yes gene_type:complete
MLLAEIKKIFHQELHNLYPKGEIDSFFYAMVEHYLGFERFILVLQPQLAITKEEEQPLFEGLAQLKKEKPLQYILGKAHFMDLVFKVNEYVLIPRPETEELVRWIIAECSIQDSGIRIFDIGTGSGCIAIALAKNLPNAQVYAIDISGKALQVAQENAEMNEVQVEFFEKDILNWNERDGRFDVIVSNPPYVRESEKQAIKNNVKKYEPSTALFVADHDPLIFYRAIAGFAQEHLNPGGWLFFEINQYLGEQTVSLLEEHRFKDIELKKDIFGNDRMIKCIKKYYNV